MSEERTEQAHDVVETAGLKMSAALAGAVFVALLAFVPIGVVDAVIGAGLVLAASRLWAVAPKEEQSAAPAVAVVAAVFLGWLLNISLIRGSEAAFVLYNGLPWLPFALVGPPIYLRLSRRHPLGWKPAVLAASVGFGTGAGWVWLGSVAELEQWLRFSPLALIVVAGASLLEGLVWAFKRRRDPLFKRMFLVFVIAQSTAVLGYLNVVARVPGVSLPYLIAATSATSEGGLRAFVDRRGKRTEISVVGAEGGHVYLVKTFFEPVTVDLHWHNDTLEVSVVHASLTHGFDCTGEYPLELWGLSTAVELEFGPCASSADLGMCLR